MGKGRGAQSPIPSHRPSLQASVPESLSTKLQDKWRAGGHDLRLWEPGPCFFTHHCSSSAIAPED